MKRQRRRGRGRRMVSMGAWASYEERREELQEKLMELRAMTVRYRSDVKVSDVHSTGNGGADAVECA